METIYTNIKIREKKVKIKGHSDKNNCSMEEISRNIREGLKKNDGRSIVFPSLTHSLTCTLTHTQFYSVSLNK